MRIVIIGCGYVGLVSGTCLAQIGNQVTLVDSNAGRIAALNSGRVPIFEPGLTEMVAQNIAAGRLHFVSQIPELDDRVDVVLIAVGTPPAASGLGADLSSVHAAAAEIAAQARGSFVVATKSTVPAGTGDAVEQIIREGAPTHRISVVSNPEFLREGSAIADFMEPDRVVVGSNDEFGLAVLAELYRPLTVLGHPLVATSRTAAEIIKYSANAFLALKIAFINEVADLCEAVSADVRQVARGVGTDRRIGPDFLQAGPGYGGSCFPKDTAALVAKAHELGVNLRLVETAIAANDARKQTMGQRIIRALGSDARNKTVAVLGLTFKPDTDDMRDAPSIALIAALRNAGVTVRAFDPEGMVAAAEILPEVQFAADPLECVTDADCVVLVTEWKQFLRLDFEEVRRRVRSPIFIDLRNAVDAGVLLRAGFDVHGIGRPVQYVAEGEEPVSTAHRVRPSIAFPVPPPSAVPPVVLPPPPHPAAGFEAAHVLQ